MATISRLGEKSPSRKDKQPTTTFAMLNHSDPLNSNLDSSPLASAVQSNLEYSD